MEVEKVDMEKEAFQEIQGKKAMKRKNEKDTSLSMEVDSSGIEGVSPAIVAPSVKKSRAADGDGDTRKVTVPTHRYTPLKEHWMKIYEPIVERLHLQVRFNLKSRQVEIRTSGDTEDVSSLQKAADFVRAFVAGFEVDDALAMLRLDDLFLDSFEIQDVKSLKGDHLSRAIGRIAGKGGRTKYTIENVTKTRIVLADSKIHILGSYQNIQIAKRALCNLILGSPPSKVYGTLRSVAARSSERF